MSFFTKMFNKNERPAQENVQFDSSQYELLLSDADRVTLEDLKEEALQKNLSEKQSNDVIQISERLAKSAEENGLPASRDDIAQFIREFYQSLAIAERSKNIEIDQEKFQNFVSLLEAEDLNIIEQIWIGVEQYGALSPEDNNRVSRVKQHFINAVEKGGYDFTRTEVESYIDELIVPLAKEKASISPEPLPTYRVVRPELSEVNLPTSRFDLGEVPKEDLR